MLNKYTQLIIFILIFNSTRILHANPSVETSYALSIVDPGVLVLPTANTYSSPDGTITTDSLVGATVGSLPGQFGVNPTGGATYSIPIECPTGINGMQPTINIVYNSQLTTGLLGRGFDLSYSSAITRVAHNIYYDNDNHTVTFDGNDRFALDGMRLICSNISNYGNDQTIYFTENNQTSRIKSYGRLGDGPQYFIVETPDGKTMEYGTTDDSRLIPSSETGVYIWYLRKITDNNGNSIEYIYSKINSEIVLSSIKYAGGAIDFLYSPSSTDNIYCVNGNEIRKGAILYRINVKGSNDYIRNYSFGMIYKNGQFLLTQVKEYYNKNGSEVDEINNGEENYLYKKPIYFYWSNIATSRFNNNLISGSLPSAPLFIDFNGDGYDDVFRIEKAGATGNEVYTQKIYQNTGSGKTETFSQIINTGNEIKALNSSINTFADVDGDGKADLIYKIKSTTQSGLLYNYNVVIKTLNGDAAYKPIYTKTYINPTYYDQDISFRSKEFKAIYGDFDGDSNTEILVIKDNNECQMIKYVQGSLISTAITTNGVNLYNISDISQGDFDGNGKMDFGFNINSTFKTYKIQNNSIVEIYSFNSSIKYVADINQDGITDIITFGDGIGNYDDVLQGNISILTYTIYLREKNNTFKSVSGELLKGNVFSNYVHQNFPTFSGAANQLTTTETINVKDVRFEDTDGDGLLNIVLLYDRKFDFEKYYHYGYSSEYMTAESKVVISQFFDNEDMFSYTNRNLTNFSYIMNSSGNIAVGTCIGNKFVIGSSYDYKAYMNLGDVESRYNFTNLQIANINGNGKKSFFKQGTWENYSGSKTFEYMESTNNFESNRYSLSQIQDSYDNRISINYKVPEKDFETASSQTYPFFNYKTGTPVVSTVTESNSTLGFSRTSSYTFENEIFHRFRGFLGYTKTTVVNPDGITTTSTANLNSTFACLLPYQETSSAKKTTTDLTLIDKGNKRYLARADKVTEEDLLNGLKTTKTFQSYDENGNPTNIRTEYGDNTGITSTETFTYTQKGSWYANKPLTYTVIKTAPNVSSQTRTKEYSYFDNGNLQSEISDKNDINQLTKSYLYDTYGNPTKVSMSAKDIITNTDVTRSTTMSYTPSGRFIQTKLNLLGQATTYHWDEANGLLTSEDGPLGTTSYNYDIWGRLTQTIYPDGVRKAQVLQWASPDNTLKAKYYIYSQTSGSAPVLFWYDALGREVAKETYGLNNKKISVFTEYLSNGRKLQISDPTFNATAGIWAAKYTYDTYGRASSVITPLGTTYTTYGKTSTITSPEGTQAVTLNDAGQKVSSKINSKEVTYTYYASGLPKTSTPSGGQTLTMDYDLQGNRKYLYDPDAGIVESKYNGFGELVEEKQKIHNSTNDIVTTNIYKTNGLLDYIVRNGETTTYTFDTKKRLSSIEITGKDKQEFTYDDFDRVTNIKETIGSKTYNTAKEYDFFGRVKKEIYPSGYYTVNTYDTYGNRIAITDNNNRPIWKAIDENARRQTTNISQGGKVTTFGFDERGFPTSTFASGVINYSYVFNNDGNLTERNDNNSTQKEKFVYDTQNRLTNWDVYHNITTLVKPGYITYNDAGNIFKKNDLIDNSTNILEMSYGGNRTDGATIGPHALATISGVPTNFPTFDLNVTYTDFKKIASLDEGTKHYELTYGVDDQRRISVYKVNNITQLTRYYIGNYEEEIDKDNNTRKIHYLSGAIFIQQDNVPDKFLYTYSDYQGSLIALANENGTVVERYAYDPWGARRNPDDWTQKDSRTTWIINRGYTGHEHLDAFSIINMNGRVYDPLTAMFMSPDPALDGNNWLSYNRYGYCLNNPFKYTDPSGNNPFLFAAAFIGAFVNFGIQMFSGNINSFGDVLKALSVGALAGLTGAWIGGAVTLTAANSGLASAIGSAGYAGAVGGTAAGFVTGISNAWMSGASFENVLKAGYTGAGMGLIAGGIGGGISGGIQYQKQMAFFIKGCEELGVDQNNAVPATDKFTLEAQKVWYPDAPMDKAAKFTVENTGDVFTENNSGAGGATRPLSSNGLLTGKSNLYFNKDIAYSSARQLYNVMGHELMHLSQFASLAGQPINLIKDAIFNNMLEFHAYNYRSLNNLNSFTRESIAEFIKQYPSFYNTMSANNFSWTSNTNFKYPF